MVFQGEDVALEKDILKKREDFIRDEKEWSAKNRRQINVQASGSGTTQITMFTVPNNFELFVTSASMWGHHGGAVGSVQSASLVLTIPDDSDNPVDATTILRIPSQSGISHTLVTSNSYPMPIRVPSGGRVLLNGNGTNGSHAEATLQGWLEAKKIS